MATMVQRQRVVRRRLIDRISALGVCDEVEGYEPHKAPPRGQLYCAVANGTGVTVPQASTLAYTAKRFSFVCHFMRALPLDGQRDEEAQIDPSITDARDTVEEQLNTLVNDWGDGVEFDPLGAFGEPMRSTPGYLDLDGTQHRTETIEVGFIAFNAYLTSRTA